jgi:hypothetical protein
MAKKFRSKFRSKFKNEIISEDIVLGDLPISEINDLDIQINESESELNERQEFMINLLNATLKSNIPLTNDGYEEMGRSQTYLDELSKPNGWAGLQNVISELPSNCWNSVPKNIRLELLKIFAVSVSR